MSKLYFKFGAMASSKTANALMTRFNYEEKGNRVWLIKPDLDNRDDYTDENGVRVTVDKSRIGLSAVADVVARDEDIRVRFAALNSETPIGAIICDECQFLTAAQVDNLKYIAEYHDVPVLCFGLRSDFLTQLFEGSKRLFEIADSISEIKSVCQCGKKAIVNARIADGHVVTVGDQIEIGGNDKYEGMCWGCWQKRI
ncbi:MAG: thymidine kinase, partial [Clostridia bacterium]|nr:thymidine kinase [Clostridia bacterium]